MSVARTRRSTLVVSRFETGGAQEQRRGRMPRGSWSVVWESARAQTRSPTPTMASATTRRLALLLRACRRIRW
jgi:hypothetical protein